MEKFMRALAEKLYTERRKEPFVKNNYIALLKTIFGREDLDDSLNDNAELEATVTKLLSTISPLSRYVLEERFLHGKTQEQLADEFRKNMDMRTFTDRLIEDVYRSVEQEFLKYMEIIFIGMEKNHFRELYYRDGVHPEGFPKNDTYYELEADKSVVDILRDTLEYFDGCGICYKDIFEKYFVNGETKEELVQWLYDNMDKVVYDSCRDGLRTLRIYPRSRYLKKFIGDESHHKDFQCSERRNGRCIYTVTIGVDEETEICSLCKNVELKNWVDTVISELSPEEEKIMRLLYGLGDGDESLTSTDVAVMLRIDTREQVEEIERRTLKALRMKATREIRTTYKNNRRDA